MARTAIRRRREKEDRKEAILAAARKVFFESGIHRATVDEIAAEAERLATGSGWLPPMLCAQQESRRSRKGS